MLVPLLLMAVTVPTAQYNNQRTGANTEETILTPRNVAPATFGKVGNIPLDGDVYAQPLYVNRTVYVATEHNSVYALDPRGSIRWHVNLGTPMPSGPSRCSFISPEIGITPTPVIDVANGTIYVLARTAETGGGEERYYQRLHALDIKTGAEKAGSPVLIRASAPGSSVTFHSVRENPRAAMLLANGTVYIAWGSSCDSHPYYGWVIGYDAHTLKQTGVFNASPDSGESGIWQSDTGIAADDEGNVYAVTGNGKFNAASGGRDYGDSVLKLRFGTNSVRVSDYFTPFNERDLNSQDDDLGSGGPVLLPDHLLAAAGKEGTIYLINRDHMGGFHAGSDAHAVQTVKGSGGMYGTPAYWNGHIYFFGRNDVLKDFALSQGRISPNPLHRGAVKFDPGAIPVVSANGAKDGIVWVVLTKRWDARTGEAILQAYDAADVSHQLISLPCGSALRFTMPLVADGRVFVGTRGGLLVLGLLKSPGR